MKKAVVTGANGFIGSALCKKLVSEGIEVIAVVRNIEADVSNINFLPNLRIVFCDLADFKNLAHVITDRNIDILYHLAWVGSAGSLRGNADIQLKNIIYACDTVQACSEMNCKRFVFSSSIMEYEIEGLMKSDSTPGINTLYSSAKISADYLARTLAGAMGVDYIRAVISNVYGPGETSPRLINSSIRKMMKGEHCAFSSGEQIYDFIYIDDAAGCLAAIGEKGIANRTYYVGSLNPRPLKYFLLEMRDQVDSKIQIGLGELPYEGIFLSYKEFDIRAVYNDTGFKPEIEFSQGIRNTIAWIKEKN